MLTALYPTTGDYGQWVFVLVTLLIGGSAAVATGRAIASTWRPEWHLFPYVLALAATVRFLQFALFQQPLLSLGGYVVDALCLLVLAFLGHRRARAAQMSERYPWAFERAGLLGWRVRRQDASGAPEPR